MATRKQARKRRRPFNPKIIAGNIAEARDQLNDLLQQIETRSLNEGFLQIGLLHAYHHLNFAWNIRRVATSRYSNLTDKDFERWGRYPAEIEKL